MTDGEFPKGPFVIRRTIPARTYEIIADWCKKDYLVMSPGFRAIRNKCRNPMSKCGLCGHPFEDGEMMGLACFSKPASGNKTVCQSCADELLASKKEPL